MSGEILIALVEAEGRAEDDRDHDRRTDAEAAPQAPGQIALQHGLIGMARIVIDGDDAAGGIFRQLLGDPEIAEILADRDAIRAQLAGIDGIFVSKAR